MRKLVVISIAFILLLGCKSEAKKLAEQAKADSLRVADSIATVIKEKPYLKERPETNPDFFKISRGELFVFKGRVATQEDVKKQEAIFYLMNNNDTTHKAADVHLPFYAYLTNKDHERDLVIILQAEVFKNDTVYGYKDAQQRFGMCYANELEHLQLEKMNFD